MFHDVVKELGSVYSKVLGGDVINDLKMALMTL